jgi:2-octaprenyl-6-methoxyphenol hydroxylase
VIANVTTSQAHQGRAFERFTAHGPLAMLPMSHGRCSLVWCHPLEKQEQILSWSDETFCHELQKAFGWRLGRIMQAGARNAYPLSLHRLFAYFTSHCAGWKCRADAPPDCRAGL